MAAATRATTSAFPLLVAALCLILTPAWATVLEPVTSVPRVPTSSEADRQGALPDASEVEAFPASTSSNADEPIGARKLQQQAISYSIQIGGSKGGWVSCTPREFVKGIPVYEPSVCVGTTNKAQATRFNAYGYKIKNSTWFALTPVNYKSLCLTLYNTTGSDEEKLVPLAAYVAYCREQKNSTLPLPANQLWASGRYSSKGTYTGVFEGHGIVLAYSGPGKPIAGRYLCNPDKVAACVATVIRVT